MKLICLHKDELNPFIRMGAAIVDLTPDGLWESAYHVVSVTDEQFSAMETIWGNQVSGRDFQDITPSLPIVHKTGSEPGFLLCRGGKIADGTKLRVNYLGNTYEAQVRGGKIWLNDKSYSSPSRAARAITRNNVNGWRFWDYFDDELNQWRKLESSPGKIKV